MKDYTIEEALEIINNCEEDQIKETIHFNLRNLQRTKDFGLIYEKFFNDEILGILKQDYNVFKIFYEHKTKPTKDIILVFAIDDDYTLDFITMMTQARKRRVGPYEKKYS